MKYTLLVALLVLGACKCPPGISENAANVEAIVAENNAIIKASTDPDVLKAIKTKRNTEALTLAQKLVEACK